MSWEFIKPQLATLVDQPPPRAGWIHEVKRDRPLLERRAKLKELVPSEHPFLFSEEFTGDADAFFKACADHQLEGIVSKLASSKYRSGRSKTWLKTKCFTESLFVIIGTARDRKTKAPLALLAQ